MDTLVIKQPIPSTDSDDDEEPMGYQAIVVEPQPESMPQLLALIVDHIDILLEDWYPTLGTRFVHTSEGKLLVTRLIPCPRCLIDNGEAESEECNGAEQSADEIPRYTTCCYFIGEMYFSRQIFRYCNDQKVGGDPFDLGIICLYSVLE